MNARRFLQIGATAVIVMITLIAYNNCSSEHTSGGSSYLSKGMWSCEDQLDEMSLFGRTYHPFLMNTCVSCHSGAGPGPGAFASSGIQLAFTSFDNLGFSRINSRATDGHSPNSGPSHVPTMNALTEQYVAGLATIQECNNGADPLSEQQDGPERIRLNSKAINPNLRNPVTVSWNLQTESRPPAEGTFNPSQFSGMRLEVDVQVFQRPGIINYVISNPRLITNSGDVHIESLLFKINGKPTPAQRAFYLVKKDIRAWNGNHPDFTKPDPIPQTQVNENEYQARLISGGALVMLGELRTTDVISVSIGKLERVTLPPPDLGPEISFGVTSQQVMEDYTIVNIPLRLNRPSNEITFAEIMFGPDTTIKDECCRVTRNDDGNQINVRHFDRDIQDFDQLPEYKINTRIQFQAPGQPGRYLVTFREGETEQVLRIKIVADDRDEPNKVLHLRIDPLRLTRLQPAAQNQDYRLTIIDNDEPYTGNSETYTDLLTDGGLLADQCLRCHNSVLNRGGYDITHYELMVNRAILIPGDPANSLMFKRMDSNTPGLAPMPLTGLLSPLDRVRVANWILNGAKNN